MRDKLKFIQKKARKVYGPRPCARGEHADPLWLRNVRHGVTTYKVNADNKLVQLALQDLGSGNLEASKLLSLLTLISKAVPIGLIRNDIEKDHQPMTDDTSGDDADEILRAFLPSLWLEYQGKTKPIVSALLEIDFFADKENLVNEAVENYASNC